MNFNISKYEIIIFSILWKLNWPFFWLLCLFFNWKTIKLSEVQLPNRNTPVVKMTCLSSKEEEDRRKNSDFLRLTFLWRCRCNFDCSLSITTVQDVVHHQQREKHRHLSGLPTLLNGFLQEMKMYSAPSLCAHSGGCYLASWGRYPVLLLQC